MQNQPVFLFHVTALCVVVFHSCKTPNVIDYFAVTNARTVTISSGSLEAWITICILLNHKCVLLQLSCQSSFIYVSPDMFLIYPWCGLNGKQENDHYLFSVCTTENCCYNKAAILSYKIKLLESPEFCNLSEKWQLRNLLRFLFFPSSRLLEMLENSNPSNIQGFLFLGCRKPTVDQTKPFNRLEGNKAALKLTELFSISLCLRWD